MRITYTLFALLLFTTTLFSQRIDNKVITRSTEEGMIYHFLAQEGFKNRTSSLEFDQTTFVLRDSVRIGISVFTVEAIRPDKLQIKCGDSDSLVYEIDVTPAFTERKKSRWKNRLFINIPREEVKSLFLVKTPPVIEVVDDNQIIELTISNSLWKKMCYINTTIYQQIDFNLNDR